MLLSPPPFPIQRHPRQDMASDQRHAHDSRTFLPYARPFQALYLFFTSYSVPRRWPRHRREWLIAGHCSSARARDDGPTESVGSGWFELVQVRADLITNDKSSPDSDTTCLLPPPTARFGLHDFPGSSALALSRPGHG